MKTDIEIARECQLAPIEEVARKINVPLDALEHYGKHIAKVPNQLINEEKVKKSNLILVTAITPTKAGIGKTTVSIGLALGLNKLGKNAVQQQVARIRQVLGVPELSVLPYSSLKNEGRSDLLDVIGQTLLQ